MPSTTQRHKVSTYLDLPDELALRAIQQKLAEGHLRPPTFSQIIADSIHQYARVLKVKPLKVMPKRKKGPPCATAKKR